MCKDNKRLQQGLHRRLESLKELIRLKFANDSENNDNKKLQKKGALRLSKSG
jgi:hypothetical protein